MKNFYAIDIRKGIWKYVVQSSDNEGFAPTTTMTAHLFFFLIYLPFKFMKA